MRCSNTDLFSEHLDCCHHGGNVDSSSEGIERDVLLFALCPHSVPNLLQQICKQSDTTLSSERSLSNRLDLVCQSLQSRSDTLQVHA